MSGRARAFSASLPPPGAQGRHGRHRARPGAPRTPARAAPRAARLASPSAPTKASASRRVTRARTPTRGSSGEEFIALEPYAAGGATDIHPVAPGQAVAALTLYLPGSSMWFRLELDGRDRIVNETIVSPGHRVTRTFSYSEFRIPRGGIRACRRRGRRLSAQDVSPYRSTVFGAVESVRSAEGGVRRDLAHISRSSHGLLDRRAERGHRPGGTGRRTHLGTLVATRAARASGPPTGPILTSSRGAVVVAGVGLRRRVGGP